MYMRTMISLLMVGVLSACPNTATRAQQYTEKIHKEFTLQKDASATTLYVYNIEGFIKVEGYEGNAVELEMDETISADSDKDLETGKKEFKLGFSQSADSILAYIAQPYDSRPNQCNNIRHEIDYQIKVNFTIKVPNDINLRISTVNNGIIEVRDVSGNLNVSNVNEGITIVNAKGTTRASTVNGDISVNHLTNPTEQCSYNTINGDIKVTYPSDFSADLQFKSMNGEFFTDFPGVEQIPMAAAKKQENKNGKMVYKLDKTNVIRFGAGGKTFRFETLNGNVYIKKQS